jgi:hypothetical protein
VNPGDQFPGCESRIIWDHDFHGIQNQKMTSLEFKNIKNGKNFKKIKDR